MSNLVMAPVHLDAFHLKRDRFVVQPMADFTRLPYFDGTRDINPDVANLSEEIVSQTFQNQNLLLKAGIHLHWALPDALTIGEHGPDRTVFPPVPNRWMVTRRKHSTIERRWVVESDYLYPIGTGDSVGSIAFPLPKKKDTDPPFRFLGRKTDLDAWPPTESKAAYLKPLTAVGYGEPALAAFYPNCHSVFGFHDDDYSDEIPAGLQYEVVGWYSDAEQDPLAALWPLTAGLMLDWPVFCLTLAGPTRLPHVQRLWDLVTARFRRITGKAENANNISVADKAYILNELAMLFERLDFYQPQSFLMVGLPDAAQDILLKPSSAWSAAEIGILNKALLQASFPGCIKPVQELLSDKFHWTVPATESPTAEPMQMSCYSRLSFNPSAETENPAAAAAENTISVANSGTEALSALLAHSLAGDHKLIIEEQLESVQLLPRLKERKLDIGPKFREARHGKEFAAVRGGSLWTLRLERKSTDLSENREQKDIKVEQELPAALATPLVRLNKQQHAYDYALGEIESMQRQTFSDWYKYMLCAYPPEDSREDYPNIDEVREFIEVKDLEPLEKKLRETGVLVVAQTQDGQVTGASSEGSLSSVAFRLAQSLNAFLSAVEVYNGKKEMQDSNSVYRLRPMAGPRYWQPNEPVVLMAGEAIQPSRRHGHDGKLRDDGLLECHILSLQGKNIADLLPENPEEISTQIDAIETSAAEGHFAFSTWAVQPWNPFLLEWQVEVYPRKDQSNLNPAAGSFSPSFITGNYNLEVNDTELGLLPGKASVVKADSVYTGRSILTPHSNIQLRDKLETYLIQQIPADTKNGFYSARTVPSENQNDTWLRKNLDQLISWYVTQDSFLKEFYASQRVAPRNQKVDWLLQNAGAFFEWALAQIESRPGQREVFQVAALMLSYSKLTGLNCLAQALSGFNEALMMHKQTMQLQIEDPLGFEDYQPFTERVRNAVQNNFRTAPQPLNDFNPIRTGILKIVQLRLIDTFGQARDLDVSKVTTIEKMRTPDNGNLVTLPPRLIQPARVNFRWLPAGEGEDKAAGRPAHTPVCGWLLSNHLDNSLMVYDNNGHALGSIDEKARWRAAPGSDQAIDLAHIPNTHLKAMVTNILSLGESFVQNFISTIDSAMQTIDPENFAEHQALSLLMGRPVALVRATVDLEVQGLPARHQGWNTFRLDLKRNYRDSDAFVTVKFPIRIGEYQQLNDGLVGYWIEKEGGYEDNVFAAPQSNAVDDPHIRTHRDGPLNFLQTINSAHHTLAMLIDPRGKVHATSGILPVKEIHIPPDQYAAALQQISVTFLSAPILSENDGIRLPLPAEPGFMWSWLEKKGNAWSEISTSGTIKKQVLLERFKTDGDRIWESLKAKGWIKEIDADKAHVVSKDQRKEASLNSFSGQITDIERLLDASYIGRVDTQASFSGKQKIHEGWLKLSRDPNPPVKKTETD